MSRRREILLLGGLLVVAAAVFFSGIAWGLPSRAADPFLFGSRRPWTGEQILALAGTREGDPSRGADVASNPITDRTHAVLLNGDDARRAAIVRRYRLFTYQPDEMITLMSLSGMKPGRLDLDPRLYQYGGLWIYPVGALLKVGSVLHLVDLRGDVAYYLDHPEAFGRFYVVARAYSAAWALAGVIAVYLLGRRIADSYPAGFAAAGAFIFLPVVVNMAHEAKPHMAGAVLGLFAVLAAAGYVERGCRRCWVTAGILCGAATGMVISGLLSFVLLPVMTVLRPQPWKERVRVTILSAIVGVAVYLVTNPYVPIDALFRRERLVSNLGNSTAMYRPSLAGVGNAFSLLLEGASPVLALAGLLAVLAFVLSRLPRRGISREAAAPAHTGPVWLLLALAGVVLVQFVLLAAGKPGEYGRFALLVDIALALAAAAAPVALVRERDPRWLMLVLLVVAVIPFGWPYERGFLRDASAETSRLAAARDLAGMPGAIGLMDEPAPYLMPPVNLWERQIVLLPKGRVVDLHETPVDFELAPVDRGVELESRVIIPARPAAPRAPFMPRISWADKRFELVPLRGFLVDHAPAGADSTRTSVADLGLR